MKYWPAIPDASWKIPLLIGDVQRLFIIFYYYLPLGLEEDPSWRPILQMGGLTRNFVGCSSSTNVGSLPTVFLIILHDQNSLKAHVNYTTLLEINMAGVFSTSNSSSGPNFCLFSGAMFVEGSVLHLKFWTTACGYSTYPSLTYPRNKDLLRAYYPWISLRP